MNDDWRLRVTLLENEHANTLTGGLAAGALEHDLTANLKDRVAVSGEGTEVFCYAGSREVLDSVRATIERLATDQKWEPEFELKRWHPAAEEWEDPDVPLPTSAGEQAAERAELMEREREEAEEDRSTEFEVRVQCNSHGDAVRLAEQLDAEGLPHARRWRYVLVGAADEDSAQALAERLRSEAPEGSEVTVEGTAGAALDERPPNIFALFGGLGG